MNSTTTIVIVMMILYSALTFQFYHIKKDLKKEITELKQELKNHEYWIRETLKETTK